jgi:hypothetical protein
LRLPFDLREVWLFAEAACARACHFTVKKSAGFLEFGACATR